MKSITLTKQEARKIIIYAAGLSKANLFGKGIEAVYKTINHLGFIQVDTNYVVERAHHHIIATRVPDYAIEWLSVLQADQRIYEFWTRDSGFMPIEDFRFSIPIQEQYSAQWKALPQSELNLMHKVFNRIGREGPLRAKDFENDRIKKSSGWWDWRPSKIALERLHLSGKLLATRTKEFHKLYDLTENVIPIDIDQTPPSREEFARHTILRSLKSLGIASEKEIKWNGRLIKHDYKSELNRLVEEKKILSVQVKDIKGTLYLYPPYHKKKIEYKDEALILSPFDIINVFRHRLRDFFDFEYQIECFVPAAKRKYGYFSLPILMKDKFVARMDSKVDRKEKTLRINNLHFESSKVSNELIKKINRAIESFAKFNNCQTIHLIKTNVKSPLLKKVAVIS